MVPLIWAGLGLVGLAFLSGCGQSTPEQKNLIIPPSTPPPDDPSDGGASGPDAGSPDASPPDNLSVSYYQDVKPILDAKCLGCHTNGPGPIRITRFNEAYTYRQSIHAAVVNRLMPPWPPGNDCVEGGYVSDRSLSQDQIDLISAWVSGGGLEGDPSKEAPPLESERLALSRIDLSLSMAAPYAPNFTGRSDDYRCFVIDWPETTTKFVTGFNVKPGNASLVHHVIAYLIEPSEAPAFEQYGPEGYECFGGGPGRMLAPWAPGTQGKDFPEGTGIRVEPGSKVALQVHYHAHHAPTAGTTDLSTMEVSLENAVSEEAENRMLLDRSIHIPDGQAEVTHRFENGIGENLLLYGALLHMHQLGTQSSMTKVAQGQDECLLEIPQWNFHWQDMYFFKNGPRPVSSCDSLGIECRWNNTADFRNRFSPPLPPGDRSFGEGSDDEMCVGIVYLTRAN